MRAKIVVLGLAALTILRLIIGATTELSEDEAYYFLWSQHLAPSYYSKGPGIAVAMKITTALFGDTAFGVRMLSPLLALGSSLLVFRLGRNLFDENTAAWSVVLLNLTPIFNAGGVLLTIDPLSIFFWIAAILTFWRALHRAKSLNFYWPLTGFLIGLGFLCKYTNALLLLSILLLLTVTRRWRGQLLRPGLYLLLASFALCTIPVFIWNAQNEWITFTHLKERGSLESGFRIRPLEFLEFFGMHFGVYSPVVFAGLLWALYRAVRRYRADDAETFLLFFALPIVLLYFLLSFNQSGQGNWTAPGFIIAGLLLVRYWQGLDISNRLKRNVRSTALTIAGVMSCIILNTEIVRQVGIPWPYDRDPTHRLRGWKESAQYLGEVLAASRRSLGEDVFVIANRYQTAAILSFYLPEDAPLLRPDEAHPKIHIVESQALQNQFSFWPRYDAAAGSVDGKDKSSLFLGRNAIYITDQPEWAPYPPPNVTNAFESWETTGVVDIVRFRQLVRRLKIFTCYNYKGLPL